MKDVPRKAVVLAAGLGERMRPLSLDLPKPLMPFWGIPPLERILRKLRSWGVEEALVNLHADAGAVVEWILAHPVDGLRVSMSFEPAILGTGGALVRAHWFPGPGPFWIANADVICALDPTPLRAALAARNTLAAVWVHSERGPRTVDVANGLVRCFRSATPGAPGTGTFCGIHLVRPEVLGFLPKTEEFCTIVSAYEAVLRAGRRIAAVGIPGSFWADLGTPRQMIEAHREWQASRDGCREVVRTSGLATRSPAPPLHPSPSAASPPSRRMPRSAAEPWSRTPSCGPGRASHPGRGCTEPSSDAAPSLAASCAARSSVRPLPSRPSSARRLDRGSARTRRPKPSNRADRTAPSSGCAGRAAGPYSSVTAVCGPRTNATRATPGSSPPLASAFRKSSPTIPRRGFS